MSIVFFYAFNLGLCLMNAHAAPDENLQKVWLFAAMMWVYGIINEILKMD